MFQTIQEVIQSYNGPLSDGQSLLSLLLFHCAIETWEHHLAQPHPQSVVPARVQMETTPYPCTRSHSPRPTCEQGATFRFRKFLFSILPPEPVLSASLPNSAISQRTGRHEQRCSEHLHISGGLVPTMVTVGGWLSEMCVLTLAGSLLSPKLGPHAKHLKRVVKCFIGTRVCDS